MSLINIHVALETEFLDWLSLMSLASLLVTLSVRVSLLLTSSTRFSLLVAIVIGIPIPALGEATTGIHSSSVSCWAGLTVPNGL